MNVSSKKRIGRRCTSCMHVHLVFVTKSRTKVFTKPVLADMRGIFAKVCTNFEAELVEFNGGTDHAHLLVTYPPKMAVSKLVNSLKSVSSRMLRKNHPDWIQQHWENALWSPSYFAGSCGGAPISNIQKFIEQQN